ncbi:hypothetical protein FA15DRAFT_671514 [Coprinopsis marcescibilis]|uniref:Nephrocystin 3-like N-terminal domain-containing protein n=1 Tax=Coprinopsis marcescibilis TaxID=230819 RepID=A0A5C3KQ70_COPMA|nr:hypothetical protein FA15DRAFT_671514 [Coprinopsis marcescibilis]
MQQQPSFHGGILSGATGVTITSSYLVAQSASLSNRMNVGLGLLKSSIATSALYDSLERFDPPKCDEDTRVNLITELSNWTKDKTTIQRILCITGPAGSGKSALQQTMVEECAESGSLLAAFFFYSQDTRRNNLKAVTPTLSYQVSQYIPTSKEPIIRAVEEDITIFDRAIDRQVQKLIVEPIREALSQPGVSPELLPRNIFIDGVDECKGEEDQAFLLRVVHELVLAISHDDFRLKVCLAGRPEYAMRTALAKNGHLKESGLLYHIDLSDHDATSDIRLFLERKLRAIARATTYPLPSTQWPSEEDIQRLVDNASGQFIYAATIVKYLSERRRSPVKQLQMILQWRPGVKQRERPFAALDALYTDIFVHAGEAYAASKDIDDTLYLVRYIRTLVKIKSDEFQPTVSAVEQMLSLDPGELEVIFSDLHSITRSFQEEKETQEAVFEVYFHHKSVEDFLQDSDRCGPLFVSSTEISYSLILPCIKFLCQKPLAMKKVSGGDSSTYYTTRAVLDVLVNALEEVIPVSDEGQLSQICNWCNELKASRGLEALGKHIRSLRASQGTYVQPFEEIASLLEQCHKLGLTSKSRHPEWILPLQNLQKLAQCVHKRNEVDWNDIGSVESLQLDSHTEYLDDELSDTEEGQTGANQDDDSEIRGSPAAAQATLEVISEPSDSQGDRRKQRNGGPKGSSLRRSFRKFYNRLRMVIS